jgi:hypothetical protein
MAFDFDSVLPTLPTVVVVDCGVDWIRLGVAIGRLGVLETHTGPANKQQAGGPGISGVFDL